MFVKTKMKVTLTLIPKEMEKYKHLPIPDMIHKICKDNQVTSHMSKFRIKSYKESSDKSLIVKGILTVTVCY